RAGARRAFEAAVTLDPRDVAAQVSLAKVLVREGEIDRAITIYQTAIELQPDSPDAWHHLGVACMSTGRAAEGARAFGEVARLRPENAVVRRDYGIALSRCGRLGEAVGELEAAVKLAPTLAPAQKELEELRRMAALEPQLSAILGSKDDRVAPAVRRDLARLCSWKNLPAAAARFWDAAFASDPRLAEDDGNRYSAACAAALAGCGRGEDAASLNGVERARWRAQALAWLRANVAAIAARAESARDEHRAALVASLVHFKRDPDLEALRDPRFTALLPDSESRACAALWREANRLLATLQSKR
ncbi:MAG: tetratricopeptide repeat protein, partial [Polyangiaceae bacterium]|nr:tetratricopeptide repeat protein [Polyangiaceae bacterium]